MKQEEKCAHPSCSCPRDKDSRYCGAYCEGAAKTPDIQCSCGHPNCSGPKQK
jgi:hypothetical protein